MFKAKILVLGPCESGKTALSNFLADATDTSSGEYHPTQGVRILEFENHNPGAGHGRQSAVEVELWDCSGDKKFEACWPAMAKDTTGIIFVYNPDQPNHDKDLENWYAYFIDDQGIKETSCCVFAHHKPSAPDRERAQLSTCFSNIPVVHTNIEEDSESVRNQFSQFLAKLTVALSDKRDQEELSIMNHR
ncbi:intraflagellar transport protein 22 homolog [Mercenaria mercenaria]|uniref:intraflagellar transport protein 22 homolog n=1 Tax=Mercenaria mercenaria TaxID=6596 RepID=UPI001E1DA595|nr:intraflagellar transport protein 22 homolog [Mercenaria mercenaria]